MITCPREPQPGQPVSATFFRDLVRYVRQNRILGGDNFRVKSVTPNGTFLTSEPQARRTAGSSATSLKPFTVRWMSHHSGDGEDMGSDGEWQVYIPAGCASIDDLIVIPDLDPATDADGREIDGWFSFDLSTSDATETTVDEKTAFRWTVYVLWKPWPRIKVGGASGAYGAVWKTFIIGTVEQWEDDGGVINHRVNQEDSSLGAKILTRADGSRFFIDYTTTTPDSRSAEWTARIINQHIMLGRLDFEIAEPKDITDWTDVYLVITHDGTEFDVALDQTAEPSSDCVTSVKLYTMSGGVAVLDNRTLAERMPFYNS